MIETRKLSPPERELLYQYCNREYPVWFAPNELWNKVARENEHFLCLTCFAELAEERGIKTTAWKLDVHVGYSEILSIIEGAVRGDIYKVEGYAELLAGKLDLAGNHSTARRIRKIIAGNAGAIIIPMELTENFGEKFMKEMEVKAVISEAEMMAIRVRNYYLRGFKPFRGRITDDAGVFVYCDRCDNGANFVFLEFFEGMWLNVPVCKRHAESLEADYKNLEIRNDYLILNPEDLRRPSYSDLEKENAWCKSEFERLNALINTPHTDDFLKAVPLEAAHQIERWKTEHDAGKTPWDWFWLIGYLAQKAAAAALAGDTEKAKHHCVSTAAVMLNWFRRLTGDDTSFRPGIKEPKEINL